MPKEAVGLKINVFLLDSESNPGLEKYRQWTYWVSQISPQVFSVQDFSLSPINNFNWKISVYLL